MEKNNQEYENVNSKPQFAIFDWIMNLPVIRIFKPLYEWKKAFWIYCFLGFVSVVCNYILTIVFTETLHIMGTVSNVLAWVLSTMISFILFRYFYFDRTNNSFINELLKFASGRIFTLVFETATVYIFCDYMGIDIKIIKAVLIPVTAILNYFISKLFVFKNKE